MVVPHAKNKYGVRDYDSEEEQSEDDEVEDTQSTTKAWSAVTQFNDIVVWGHEDEPAEKSDLYIAGLRDMVKLSQLVSKYCYSFFFPWVQTQV